MDNEKNKPVTSNLDVTAFDEKDLPPATLGEQANEELPHIEVEYDLTADEVRTGLYAFQKKVLFKRNLIYTILFGAVFILYGYDMLINGNRTVVAWLGIILCVVVTFFVWFQPRRHREQLSKAMSEVEDKFTMDIYEEYIFIREENGGSRIFYKEPKVFVIEDQEKFVVGVGRERIYVLPKRCLVGDQLEQIKKSFAALGERFEKI